MLQGIRYWQSTAFAGAIALVIGAVSISSASAEDDCQRARQTFSGANELSKTDDFVRSPVRLTKILTATDDAGYYVKIWCEDRSREHAAIQTSVRNRLAKSVAQLSPTQLQQHCAQSHEDAKTSVEQSKKFLEEDVYSSARIEASIAQTRYQRLMSHCQKSDPQFYMAELNVAQSLNRVSTCRELSELATLTMMHGDVLKSRAGLGGRTPQSAKEAYQESAEFLNRAIGYCRGEDRTTLGEKMAELDVRRGIKRRTVDGETTAVSDVDSWYASWASGGEDDDNDF